MFGLKALHLLEKPATVDMRSEINRRASQRVKILTLLKTSQTVTTIDLQRIAYNYTMRISELRKDGHKILATYEKPGVFHYTYKGWSEL